MFPYENQKYFDSIFVKTFVLSIYYDWLSMSLAMFAFNAVHNRTKPHIRLAYK